MEYQEQLNEALQRELGLQLPAVITEDELLQMLADRLADLIARNPEDFFQLMYRLDIPETAMNKALSQNDIPGELAKLVYTRQLQKIESRAKYGRAETDDPELQW
jgi:hypothetical protein